MIIHLNAGPRGTLSSSISSYQAEHAPLLIGANPEHALSRIEHQLSRPEYAFKYILCVGSVGVPQVGA